MGLYKNAAKLEAGLRKNQKNQTTGHSHVQGGYIIFSTIRSINNVQLVMVALVMAALVMVASQLLTMRVSINNVQLVNGYRSKPTGYRPGNGYRPKLIGYRSSEHK